MALHPRQFLRTWVISIIVMLLSVGAYNAGIDPYGLTGTARIRGLNASKTAIDTQQDLIKSYDVLRVDPHTLILGSSQVALGMDARYAAQLAHAMPGYNLGLPRAGVYEAYRYLQHVTSRVGVNVVVLGIEFRDFLDFGNKGQSEFESRLTIRSDGTRTPDLLLQHTRDVAWSLFSLQAFSDSLLTLEQNAGGSSSDFTAGYWDNRVFRPGGKWFARAPVFFYVDLAFARGFSYVKVDSKVMQYMADILNLCRSRGVRLIIVLNPSYADELEMLNLTGLWNVFEDWKRGLVSLVAGYTGKGNRFDIWDFCDYSIYATEPVPENRLPMRWFLDPVHYSKDLGNLILERIFGKIETPFGVQLTPKNLDGHLAEIRAERLKYLTSGSRSVRRVRNAYRLAMGTHADSGD